MSEKIVSVRKKGSKPIEAILIGDSYTINSTSVVTRTLTDDISNYRYVLFSMSAITDVDKWIPESTGQGGMAFVPVDYFKQTNIILYYTAGATGSGVFHSLTLSYISDTSFTSKASATQTRYLHVYGIK